MNFVNLCEITVKQIRDKEPFTAHTLKLFKYCPDTVHTQVKGTPTGSLVSGVAPEAVPRCLERKAMEQFQPRFWARRVDVTFVIIKREDKNPFLDALNGVCPDI